MQELCLIQDVGTDSGHNMKLTRSFSFMHSKCLSTVTRNTTVLLVSEGGRGVSRLVQSTIQIDEPSLATICRPAIRQ